MDILVLEGKRKYSIIFFAICLAADSMVVINSLHTHINKLKKFNYKKIFMSIIKIVDLLSFVN